MRLGQRSKKAIAAAAAAGLLFGTAGCTVDGTPVRVGGAPDTGAVDTDQFEGLLTECSILPTSVIAETVGGSVADPVFFGAICRWVVAGAGITDVTLAWYEWGDLNLEKQTAKRLGFETENVQIKSMAAFTQRDPKRSGVCGVTAKSPGRGILTWWVEPQAGGQDACTSATKLMELVLDAAG